jgi:hypothetical protein
LLATAFKPRFRQRNHIIIPRYPGVIDRLKQITEDVPQMQDRLCAKSGLRRCNRREMEAIVFREQMINFLQAAVVFLLVTNALSIAATTYAIQLLNGLGGGKREKGIIERKLNAIVQRAC